MSQETPQVSSTATLPAAPTKWYGIKVPKFVWKNDKYFGMALLAVPVFALLSWGMFYCIFTVLLGEPVNQWAGLGVAASIVCGFISMRPFYNVGKRAVHQQAANEMFLRYEQWSIQMAAYLSDRYNIEFLDDKDIVRMHDYTHQKAKDKTTGEVFDVQVDVPAYDDTKPNGMYLQTPDVPLYENEDDVSVIRIGQITRTPSVPLQPVK